MRGWVVRELGPPGNMRLEDLPLGAAPRDKVRVAVKAAGINFFDSLLIAGTSSIGLLLRRLLDCRPEILGCLRHR